MYKIKKANAIIETKILLLDWVLKYLDTLFFLTFKISFNIVSKKDHIIVEFI